MIKLQACQIFELSSCDFLRYKPALLSQQVWERAGIVIFLSFFLLYFVHSLKISTFEHLKKSAGMNKFNEKGVARVSEELFDIEKLRMNLSTGGYRLLYAISQCVDSGFDFKLPLVIEKSDLFKFLGLDKTKARYERLDDVLKEVAANPLHIVRQNKRGGIDWIGESWITGYLLSSSTSTVTLKVNPDIKPYLVDLRKYACIQPQHYLKLSTSYQNLLYPFLKNTIIQGGIRIEISRLISMLSLEKEKTYDASQNPKANEKFFTRILGIKKPKGKLANPATSWEWITNSKGESTGTLYNIAQTDIYVSAWAEKTRGKYTHVVFKVREKMSDMSAKRKAQLLKKATQNDIQDMGPRQTRSQSTAQTRPMVDLFANMPRITQPKQTPQKAVITQQTLEDMAKNFSLAPEQLAQQMGYTKNDSGSWEK